MADPIRLSHSDIDDWRERYFPDGRLIKQYRDYAAGVHSRIASLEMRKVLGQTRPNAAADNLLDLAMRTTAGRLNLEGFEVPNKAVQDFLDEWYLKNRLSGVQFDTHYAALRDGITALSLRFRRGDTPGDPGRVTVHREAWWDGVQGVFVGFDDYDDPIWAVRDWVDYNGKTESKRRNVYYPDAFYRYIKEGGGWKPFRLDGDPEDAQGRIPWLKRDGTPLGLPIVPFSNAVADTGNYGRSDLTGLLGIQDDINQIGLDLTAAALYTGFQMITATGVTIDELKAKVGPGRFLSADSADARFGTIQAGSLESLIRAYESKRQTIAILTATPMHVFGGQWPSGEALMRAEMPLVDKATRLGAVEAPSWTTLAHRSTEIANTFGGTSLDEASPITAVYSAPEHLDELTEVQVQKAHVDLYSALGNISDPELMIKTGLVDKAEADAIIQGRADRAEQFAEPVAQF